MKQMFSKEEVEKLINDNIDEAIEANPTLEGDEDALESIEIKGTKYSVGGGGDTLYRHTINESTDMASLTILMRDDTPFTKATLGAWLYNNGYNSQANAYSAGSVSTNVQNIASGIYSVDGNYIFLLTAGGSRTYSGTGLVDIISEV